MSENPPARSPGCTFFLRKSWRPICRPQNTGRQRRFAVKIKEKKRSDMVTFLFSVHTITEEHYYRSKAIRMARQGEARAVDLPVRSFVVARPGVGPPLMLHTFTHGLPLKSIFVWWRYDAQWHFVLGTVYTSSYTYLFIFVFSKNKVEHLQKNDHIVYLFSHMR